MNRVHTCDLAMEACVSRTDHGEAVIIHAEYEPGRFDTLAVVVERQGIGISSASLMRGLSELELGELIAMLSEVEERPPTSIEPQQARQVIARGLLVGRILRRPMPRAVEDARDLLGDLAEAYAAVEDFFLCHECGAGLPGGAQLALARREISAQLLCDECRGREVAMLRPVTRFVPRWIARAQLHLDAREPRLALATAARAADDGAPKAIVARIRGWAHLELGNPVQAAAYLREALAEQPHELRTRTLLIIAEAQAHMIAGATAQLDHMTGMLPGADTIIEPVRLALAELGATAGVQDLRRSCLAALNRLESELARAEGTMTPRKPAPARPRPASAMQYLQRLGA